MLRGKSKKAKIIAVSAAAALAAAAFAGAAYAGAGGEIIAEEAKKDVVVDTLTPETGNITVIGEYIGTMEPSRKVTVYPKASGEVLAVNYGVGDIVEAGDVLFVLDSKALETSIAKAQASLASAQAKADQSLAMAQTNLDNQKFNLENGHDATLKNAENAVDNAQAAVDRADNGYRAAEIALKAARRQLREFLDDGIYPISMLSLQNAYADDQIEDQLKDAVSQARMAMESAALGLEQANSGLEKAKDAYETAKVMIGEQQTAIKNQLEMAKLNADLSDYYIDIQKLRDDLANYNVAAPIGGVIEARGVEQFNMASPGTPAFVISDKDSMTVSFKVPGDYCGNINVGGEVTLTDNGSAYTAAVTEISTMVDQSGLFTVKARVANPPPGLYTGACVKVYAAAQTAQNALTVPLSAVYYDNGRPYVYIAENGLAKKVIVEAGIYDDKNIQILSGIKASDQIISTWSSNLTDNAEIVLASEVRPTEDNG